MATSNYLVEASSLAHSDDVWALKHLPDGRVLSGSADGSLKLWDPSDPDTAIQSFTPAASDGSRMQAIVGLDIEQNTASPSFFIASTIDSTVSRFSFSSSSPEGSWSPPDLTKKPGQAWSVSIHPDPSKETFATTGLGGLVRILSSNATTFGEEKSAIQGKGDFVSVRYSPNGRVLGTVNSEGQVALYDAEDGQLVQYWMAHTGNIRSFAFARDSSLLITGGDDKQINVYDIKGLLSVREEKQSNGYRSGNTAASNGNLRSRYSAVGQHVANLQGHTGWILDLSCRDDGKVFASSSSDGTIRLWDLQRPASACLAVLREHESDVWAVSWAPMPPSAHSIEGISGGGLGGGKLVSGGKDGRLRWWRGTG